MGKKILTYALIYISKIVNLHQIRHHLHLPANCDPGVPYTYIHTYILPGSVLAAKSDPGVPYMHTHACSYENYTRSGSVLTVAGHACTNCTWT